MTDCVVVSAGEIGHRVGHKSAQEQATQNRIILSTLSDRAFVTRVLMRAPLSHTKRDVIRSGLVFILEKPEDVAKLSSFYLTVTPALYR